VTRQHHQTELPKHVVNKFIQSCSKQLHIFFDHPPNTNISITALKQVFSLYNKNYSI